MDTGVIRNKRQAQALCEKIMKGRLPFKYALQSIYPLRSLESNNYYWGIVLKYISDESGHSEEECHEEYKRKFNFKYDLQYNHKTDLYEWVMGTGSTTIMDDKEIWEYIFKVRVDGELEHHILIPLPNESFVPELDFKHERKRL